MDLDVPAIAVALRGRGNDRAIANRKRIGRDVNIAATTRAVRLTFSHNADSIRTYAIQTIQGNGRGRELNVAPLTLELLPTSMVRVLITILPPGDAPYVEEDMYAKFSASMESAVMEIVPAFPSNVSALIPAKLPCPSS